MVEYRVIAVEARPDYRLWVRFEDGVEGEVDLSDLAGHGVFRRWTESPEEFAKVAIDPACGAPTWPGDLDVAPDRLHAELAAAAKI
jgi:glycine/D-amino acid oxidase-like deaminating enzyme